MTESELMKTIERTCGKDSPEFKAMQQTRDYRNQDRRMKYRKDMRQKEEFMNFIASIGK